MQIQDAHNCAEQDELAISTYQEEEEMARSGDPGVSVDTRFDPWASGRWDELEKIRLSNVSSGRRMDEIEAQSGDAGDTILPYRSSFSSRSGHSIPRTSSCARSIRKTASFADNDNNKHQMRFPLDDAKTSVIDLSIFGLPHDERCAASPESAPVHPTDFLSPLSDMPLIPGLSSDIKLDESFISLSAKDLHTFEGQVGKRTLHWSVMYASNLVHLATFGILGVLIRYGLEILYGRVLTVTSDKTALFTDIIPNMVGSYFMGWVGIVLKKEISLFSEPLAIGLSTGLMGSITTFATWNQKMVELLAGGHWAAALFGYIVGMELSQMSLLIGIESAKFLKWTIKKMRQRCREKDSQGISEHIPENYFCRQICSLAIFLFFGGSLWVAAVILTILDTKSNERQTLWLACTVGPLGVWARWYLARLNGRGINSKFIWLPVGTLLTNIIAASLEAALSVVSLAVNDDDITLICKGLMIGFLGCMSTVSTFVTEVYTMHGGPKQARAFSYTLSTLCPAFLLGTLIYCVPSWVKKYVEW